MDQIIERYLKESSLSLVEFETVDAPDEKRNNRFQPSKQVRAYEDSVGTSKLHPDARSDGGR